MSSERAALRRAIPQVAKLLASEEILPLLATRPRAEVVAALRQVLAELRGRAVAGDLPAAELALPAIARRAEAALAERGRAYYRPVINATGVVLHTNLGRAPLAAEAVAALGATAGGAQRLELDLETGERGGRDDGCARLLVELTGAEAATIVNNNAAATLLILAALARGRKVIVSRGELVEIGGSYRIPEILAESGAHLAEVGTTNRTHLRDYARALDGHGLEDQAGLLLKVHTSNYRIQGFTAEVGIEELVTLGAERGVPVVHDLGSGCLVDLGRRGLGGEPLVGRSVAAGCDLVCFSADKLLGGPQAGILVGKAAAVERCRKQPLFRALRPGRLVYTALEATLRLYAEGEEAALARVPALARLTAPASALRRRAERLARRLARLPGLSARAVPCVSQAGSGALPAVELPSFGVEVRAAGRSAVDLAADLRQGEPAVLGRLHDGALLLDLRTVAEDEVAPLVLRMAQVGGAA